MGRHEEIRNAYKNLGGRTDWFIEKIYTPRGFFTPPYETAESLRRRLERMYRQARVTTVEGMASFRCEKGV